MILFIILNITIIFFGIFFKYEQKKDFDVTFFSNSRISCDCETNI